MKMAQWLLVCIGGFLVLRYGAPLFFPIFLGWLASDGVRRITDRIAPRLSLPRRSCAIVLAVLALCAAVCLLCAVGLLLGNAGKSVWTMLQTLRRALPALCERLSDAPLADFPLSDWLHRSATAQGTFGAQWILGWEAWAAHLAKGAASLAASFAGRTLDAAGNGMAKVLLTVGVFLFRCAATDREPLRNTLLCRLSAPMRAALSSVFSHLDRIVDAAWGYLRAAVGLSGCAFAVFAGIFTLCRIPNGLFLACLAAAADLLPVVGAGIVLLPWAIVQLLTGESAAGWTILAALAAQWILRQLLEPKWYGRVLRLPPCLTLIAAYLGYAAAGFPGLLLLPLALAGFCTGADC